MIEDLQETRASVLQRCVCLILVGTADDSCECAEGNRDALLQCAAWFEKDVHEVRQRRERGYVPLNTYRGVMSRISFRNA